MFCRNNELKNISYEIAKDNAKLQNKNFIPVATEFYYSQKVFLSLKRGRISRFFVFLSNLNIDAIMTDFSFGRKKSSSE